MTCERFQHESPSLPAKSSMVAYVSIVPASAVGLIQTKPRSVFACGETGQRCASGKEPCCVGFVHVEGMVSRYEYGKGEEGV